MSLRDGKSVKVTSLPAVEDIIEKRLEEIVTILDSGKGVNGNMPNLQ